MLFRSHGYRTLGGPRWLRLGRLGIALQPPPQHQVGKVEPEVVEEDEFGELGDLLADEPEAEEFVPEFLGPRLVVYLQPMFRSRHL